MVGDVLKFVKENMIVIVFFYNGVVFGVELLRFVEFEVIDIESGFKGDIQIGVIKFVKVEIGVVI